MRRLNHVEQSQCRLRRTQQWNTNYQKYHGSCNEINNLKLNNQFTDLLLKSLDNKLFSSSNVSDTRREVQACCLANTTHVGFHHYTDYWQTAQDFVYDTILHGVLVPCTCKS